MADHNLSEGDRLNKLNGTIAGSAEWEVIETKEDFGGDIFRVVVVSESEYEQFDGHRREVRVEDIGTEWEVVG